MSKIEKALTDREKHLIPYRLTTYEQVVFVFGQIKLRSPDTKFTHSDVGEYLYGDPGRSRGIPRMIRSIREKYPDFPIEMIELPPPRPKERDIRPEVLIGLREELAEKAE